MNGQLYWRATFFSPFAYHGTLIAIELHFLERVGRQTRYYFY